MTLVINKAVIKRAFSATVPRLLCFYEVCQVCRDLIEEGTMPPACRLNAKQTEDEETRLRLESEAVLLAQALTGKLMSATAMK